MKGATPQSRLPPSPAKTLPTSQASALARLGLEVSKQVRRELLRRLHTGDIRYARRLTRTRTVVVVEYGGGEFCFLYSNSTKEILRFLAPDAPETENCRRARPAAGRLLDPVTEPVEAAS